MNSLAETTRPCDDEEATEAKPGFRKIFGIVITAATPQTHARLRNTKNTKAKPPRVFLWYTKDIIPVDGVDWNVRRSVLTHFPFVTLVRAPNLWWKK